jgi:rhodanese-related sulfurtransferase
VPLDQLRDRMGQVPRDGRLVVHCAGGYRSYVAQRILMNHGRTNVRNITGGYKTIAQTRKALAQEAQQAD